jgi:hypothetical protein
MDIQIYWNDSQIIQNVAMQVEEDWNDLESEVIITQLCRIKDC